MNCLPALLATASLEVSDQNALGDWHIWLTNSSGWGNRTGVYIDSSGRNVAYDETSGSSFPTDLRKDLPTSFCDKLPLSEYQVRKFAFRISSIPYEVLEKRALLIAGSCADEPLTGVMLKMHGQDFHFGYSQEKQCRNGRDVPDWLFSLVNALQLRYREIKGCSETPLDAKSDP